MSFVPNFTVMLGFTAACILLAITPGPDMTLFLSRTVSGGRGMGLAALLGASAGLVVQSLLAAFGISALLAASVTAFTILKVVGVGYLLFLAYQAIRDGSALALTQASGNQSTYTKTFLTGVGINLTNPKVVLFFLTFLPQFVDAHDPQGGGKLLFLGLYFLVLGTAANLLIWALASRFIGAIRSNPKALRFFDYGFAALMSAFALKLLTAQGR